MPVLRSNSPEQTPYYVEAEINSPMIDWIRAVHMLWIRRGFRFAPAKGLYRSRLRE